MRRKPDIDEEEVGSRSFEVHCSRDVEAALGRIRHGLGSRWKLFLPEEIATLEWMLRETWAITGSRAWQGIGFSYAGPELVEEIVAWGERARGGKTLRLVAARKVKCLLLALPPPGESDAGGEETPGESPGGSPEP